MQFLCTIKSYKEFKMKYQIIFKAKKAIKLLAKKWAMSVQTMNAIMIVKKS